MFIYLQTTVPVVEVVAGVLGAALALAIIAFIVVGLPLILLLSFISPLCIGLLCLVVKRSCKGTG